MCARASWIVALCVVALAGSPSFGADASFQGLGILPGGDPNGHSQAMGVSADGLVVVGISHSANGIEAFRWEGGVMTGLGDIAGGDFDSRAFAVSADGSVIVGLGTGGTSDKPWQWAVRWDNGAMSELGMGYNYATAVSADGSAITLNSIAAFGQPNTAYLWQDGVMTPLGALGGIGMPWPSTEARGISADGTVVVGVSGDEAFRWEAGEIVGLAGLPGPRPTSTAAAASIDGSVIVGQATGGADTIPLPDILAVRWEDGVISGLGYTCALGSAGWHVNEALAVSANGSVVVGRSICLIITTSSPWTPPGTPTLPVETNWSDPPDDEFVYSGVGEAFVWTRQTGMQDLRDVLMDLGVDVSAWEYLTSATGVSADGSTIVGYGINADGDTEAWIATLPPRLDVHVVKPELGSVTIDPDLPWYTDPNTEVTLEAVPDTSKGATFTGWLIFDPDHPGDANHASADANDTVTVVMDRPRELQASFWADHALTMRWWHDLIDLDPLPADANAPRYEHGTEVTLTAVPELDHLRFHKWYVFDPNFPGDVNHVTVEPNNPLTLVMDVDWEVQAYYAAHYDIPDDCGDGAALALPLAMAVLGACFIRRRGD